MEARPGYPPGAFTQYFYNKTGHRVSMISWLGTFQYPRDPRNLLKGVTDPGYPAAGIASGTTSYTRDARGQITQTVYPNGALMTATYDAVGLPQRIYHCTSAGTLIDDIQYTRDLLDLPMTKSTRNGTISYTYDGINQLVSENSPIAGRTTLTYDLVGRRLTQQTPTTLSQFAYDASDALTTLTSNGLTTIYGYDNNGNRTNRSGPAGFFAYNWDDQDRLVEVVTPTAGTFTMGYGYDSLRLWQLNGDGSRSSYVYDGDEVLSWQKGALSQVLVWGEGVIRSIGTTTMGTAQDRIFHADAQGTTAATTTGSQAIETGYQTDAWGNTLAGSAAQTIPTSMAGAKATGRNPTWG